MQKEEWFDCSWLEQPYHVLLKFPAPLTVLIFPEKKKKCSVKQKLMGHLVFLNKKYTHIIPFQLSVVA